MSKVSTKTLIRSLSRDHLRNMSSADPVSGTIADKEIPIVISAINSALLEMFTSKNLMQREVLIQSIPGVNKYVLREDYLISNTDSPVTTRYLSHPTNEDSFEERFVGILQVFDSFGREFAINVREDPYSVFTIENDVLQIPFNSDNMIYHVLYQATHKRVTHPFVSEDPDTSDLEYSDIFLPPGLEEALLSLVAAKYYMSMNGDAHLAKAAMLEQKYNSLMYSVQLTNSDRTSILSDSSNRFTSNGFV